MPRHRQYLKYVLRHKWFVFLAGLKLGVPIWILFFHDWDKFLPDEWFPYAKTFYNKDGSKRYEEFPEFAVAWNHHQKRNKHHWQYWLLTWDRGDSEPLPMPDLWRREMLADWRGAGRALGFPDTAGWYAKNRDKMKLHPDTRTWIESQLNEGQIARKGNTLLRLFKGFFLLLLIAFVALVVPALAQEAPAATPIVTVAATPAPAVEQPPVIVVPVPSTSPTAPSPEPSLWQIIWTVCLLALTVFEVGKLIARRAPASELDSAVVNRLQSIQDNREVIDRLERAYQAAGRQQQMALDTVASIVRFIAPMTPGIRADDALAGVLADIQQPGAPSATAPVALPPSGPYSASPQG